VSQGVNCSRVRVGISTERVGRISNNHKMGEWRAWQGGQFVRAKQRHKKKASERKGRISCEKITDMVAEEVRGKKAANATG